MNHIAALSFTFVFGLYIIPSPLMEVADYFSTLSKVKGEIVLLLSPPKPQFADEKEVNETLLDAIEYMSLKDAVSFVSKRLSIPKKIVIRPYKTFSSCFLKQLGSFFKKASIFNLPFKDNEVDGIYNLGVMEHTSE